MCLLSLGLDRTSSKRESLTVTSQTWGIRSSLLRMCLDVSLHPPPPDPKKSVNDTLLSSGRACLGSRHLLSRRAPRYRDAGAIEEACRPALAMIPPWSCTECVSGCSGNRKRVARELTALLGWPLLLSILAARKSEGAEMISWLTVGPTPRVGIVSCIRTKPQLAASQRGRSKEERQDWCAVGRT